VSLKTEAYSPLYLADQAAGKMQMSLQATLCHWAGPDDFLHTPFHYASGAPLPMYQYQNDALNTLVNDAMTMDDLRAEANWQKAQDLLAADMPTVPLMSVKLPAAARKYVMGFVGSGNHTEVFGSVWLNK